MKYFQQETINRTGLNASSYATDGIFSTASQTFPHPFELTNATNVEFWLACVNYPLQALWDLRIHYEDYLRSPLFPVSLCVGFFFTTCTLYMIMDLLLKDVEFFHRFKIQYDNPPTWPMIRKAIGVSLMNNAILILPSAIAQYIWVPPTPLPPKAPSAGEFLAHIILMLVIFDFQYWLWHVLHHRNRWLYKTFHAIHHQYHSVFSWTTQYLHPWELFTVGFFSTVDGWFFECHPLTYWCYMVINIFLSIDVHAGYDFPLFPHKWIPFGFYGGGPKHDMHHMRPLTNFQPYFRTWDRIFDWDCPGMVAGGKKSEALLKWEQRNRDKRMNRYAVQLMKGTENGTLMAVDTEEAEPGFVSKKKD